jgi:hypothetical protein
MDEGHARRECARANCLGCLSIILADRFGGRNHLHQHGPYFTLGRDGRIDQRGGSGTFTGVAVLSLWPVQTRRVRNGSEQPGFRPEPSRSQPDLGSARPRGSCCDSPLRWILGSRCHRNARKQSERAVPPDVILTARLRPACERSL